MLYGGTLKTNRFKNKIDYNLSTVRTKYGICGIKI